MGNGAALVGLNAPSVTTDTVARKLLLSAVSDGGDVAGAGAGPPTVDREIGAR